MQEEPNIRDGRGRGHEENERGFVTQSQFLPGLNIVSGSYLRLEQQLTKPAKCLPIKVIWELAQKLHDSRARVGHWINLAENLGYGREMIEQFITEGGTQREPPGYMMLFDWTKQEKGRSLYVLIETLRSMGRQDCVEFLLQKIEEMMFMSLFIHIVDETSSHSTSQHLKIRTMCDCSIKDSLENLLAGNSDDYEYEVVDVPLHEKASKYKGVEIKLRRKHKTERNSESVFSAAKSIDFVQVNQEAEDTTVSHQFLSLPVSGEPISSLQMTENEQIKSTTFPAVTSENTHHRNIYENIMESASSDINVKSVIPEENIVQSLGIEDKSLPCQPGEGFQVREAFQTNSLFVEVSMTPGIQHLQSPSVIEDTSLQRANMADSHLHHQREDFHRLVGKDPSFHFVRSPRFTEDIGIHSNFTSLAQPDSVIPRRKLQYITEECVYCGKTKTTKLVTNQHKQAVSAGVHCPSCRCVPPIGVNPPTANDHTRSCHQSRDLVQPISEDVMTRSCHQSCDQIQPISEDVISSTTKDDTEASSTSCIASDQLSSDSGYLFMQQTRQVIQTVYVPMETETKVSVQGQSARSIAENVESINCFQHSQTIDSDERLQQMYLTTENQSQTSPFFECDGCPPVFYHDHSVETTISRPRSNTHPVVSDPMPSPDFCIAEADSAFRHLKNEPSQSYSKSEEDIQTRKKTEISSSSTRPVHLTKTHVCDILRNFPGWNPDVDEKNVEKTMKGLRGVDGHYVIWFMGSKNRLVLSVSHLSKLIHYAIYAELNRQGAVSFRIFDEQFGDLRTLLRYYQKNGLLPQSQQGQNDDVSFTDQQNLRDSRRIACLSHVRMKFPFGFRMWKSSDTTRKSV